MSLVFATPFVERPFVVAVAAGRESGDRALFWQTLDRVHAATPISELVHGCARAAGAATVEWATSRGVRCVGIPANWKADKDSATEVRNQKILDYGPQLLLVIGGGSDNQDVMDRALSAGIAVAKVDAAEDLGAIPALVDQLH